MSTLFPRPFTIIRNTRVLGPKGTYILGTPQTLTFDGSIQPLSGKDLLVLEPGSRDIGKVWIYTGSQLKKRVEGSQDVADTLVHDGARWEIISDQGFQNGIIPHRKYMAEYRGQA